jgi:hypothetical protein
VGWRWFLQVHDLEIEADVLLAAREVARQRGVSMGKALSHLARQALSHQDASTTRNGVPYDLPIRAVLSAAVPDPFLSTRDSCVLLTIAKSVIR